MSEETQEIDEVTAEIKSVQFEEKGARRQRGSKILQNRSMEAEVPVKTTRKRRATVIGDGHRRVHPSHDDSNDSDSDRLHIAWEEHCETQSSHSEDSQSSGATSRDVRLKGIRTGVQLGGMSLHTPQINWNSMIKLHNHTIPIEYHKNMARKFPGKSRTPEQVELRRRNTEAARISRAKAKMVHWMMEKEADEMSMVNATVKRMVASQLAYANSLCRLLDLPAVKMTFTRAGCGMNRDVE